MQLSKKVRHSHTLVIGGGGFIGRHVVSALLGVGTRVRVVDFVAAPTDMDEVEWISGSITDNTLVASAADGCDSAVFLANASLPGSSQSDFEREAIGHIGASLRVAEICKDQGVEQFVFASSGGTVYGYDSPPGGLTERCPTRPLSGYGVSKLSIEHYLRLMNTQGPMRTLSLRLSNPYGEGQRPHRAQGVVAAAMQHAISGTTMPIWGDGSVERDFVHVDDVAAAFLAGLSYDGAANVINIGSGEALSIKDILRLTRDHTGRDLVVDFQPHRRIDVQRNELCITRAAGELGWAPQISISDGMARTASWWRRT